MDGIGMTLFRCHSFIPIFAFGSFVLLPTDGLRFQFHCVLNALLCASLAAAASGTYTATGNSNHKHKSPAIRYTPGKWHTTPCRQECDNNLLTNESCPVPGSLGWGRAFVFSLINRSLMLYCSAAFNYSQL